VADHLAALGYRVSLQRFRFHPSSLLGLPILAAGLGAASIITLPLLTLPSATPGGALLVWLIVLAASAVLAAGVGAGWVALGEAREDANLIAVRSDAPIRRWIVAHLDTKAQGHSMAGRLRAVWVILAASAASVAVAVMRLWGPVPLWLAAAVTALSVAAGALAGGARLRGASRGARDNGSGVVAALAGAEQATDPATGILITGAEEFGMVGARIFAQTHGKGLARVEVLNLDTIDQEGHLYVVSHDRTGAALAGMLIPRLAALGLTVRVRRLPLGILVDSLPLARAGAAALTIGRLTRRTLRLIHTPADVPENLSLDTAERVGRAIVSN
jgi:Iap family predicted aminopeptidase